MTNQELEAMKAAFLARGGAVQVAVEGEGAGLTNADWREAMRTPGRFDAKRLGSAIDAEHESENYMQRMREENGYYKS